MSKKVLFIGLDGAQEIAGLVQLERTPKQPLEVRRRLGTHGYRKQEQAECSE